MTTRYDPLFIAAVFWVGFLPATVVAETYVEPDDAFLHAVVLARPGIEDLGHTTVSAFVAAVGGAETRAGRPLKVQGWTRMPDGYALNVIGDQSFTIEFVWTGGGTALLRPVTIGDKGIPSVLYIKTYMNQ